MRPDRAEPDADARAAPGDTIALVCVSAGIVAFQIVLMQVLASVVWVSLRLPDHFFCSARIRVERNAPVDSGENNNRYWLQVRTPPHLNQCDGHDGDNCDAQRRFSEHRSL